MAGRGTQNCYSNCRKDGRWRKALQMSVSLSLGKNSVRGSKKPSSHVRTEAILGQFPLQSKQGNSEVPVSSSSSCSMRTSLSPEDGLVCRQLLGKCLP